jgi:biopolymer transport protein ExbD
MALSLKDPHDGDIAEISDINVTPFIDVILVPLIIFMVAAPALHRRCAGRTARVQRPAAAKA